MDEPRSLRGQTKEAKTKVKAFKNSKLELEQKSKHAAAAKMREDLVRKELCTIKGELVASCVEGTDLRWGRNEMVPRTRQAKIDMMRRSRRF